MVKPTNETDKPGKPKFSRDCEDGTIALCVSFSKVEHYMSCSKM